MIPKKTRAKRRPCRLLRELQRLLERTMAVGRMAFETVFTPTLFLPFVLTRNRGFSTLLVIGPQQHAHSAVRPADQAEVGRFVSRLTQ